MAVSREKVLYFEPQPSEQTAALKTVLVRMGVRIQNVEAVSAGQTVGFLLNRKGFEPTDATADAPSAPMMVLDGAWCFCAVQGHGHRAQYRLDAERPVYRAGARA